MPPGTPISPSGWVVVHSSGRRGDIKRPKSTKGYPDFRKCTWCKGDVKAPRRLWCSDECLAEYQKTDLAIVRYRMLQESYDKRTGYPCALCDKGAGGELDHTVPIVEGGHPFDPSNLRILCYECHKAETKALAGRRARRRKAERSLAKMSACAHVFPIDSTADLLIPREWDELKRVERDGGPASEPRLELVGLVDQRGLTGRGRVALEIHGKGAQVQLPMTPEGCTE